jgi:hypothetical protein
MGITECPFHCLDLQLDKRGFANLQCVIEFFTNFFAYSNLSLLRRGRTEFVVIAWMLKPGNYNVFQVVRVIFPFTTIPLPGDFPIFRISSHICMVTKGFLITFLLASFFQEGDFQITALK